MVSVTFEIDTFDHKLCLYAFSIVKFQGELLDGVALAEERESYLFLPGSNVYTD
jgi:hypothetical protein